MNPRALQVGLCTWIILGGLLLSAGAQGRSADTRAGWRSEFAWLERRAGGAGVPDSNDIRRASELVERLDDERPHDLNARIHARVHWARLLYRKFPSDSAAYLASQVAGQADHDSSRISLRVRTLAHIQAAESFQEYDSTEASMIHARTAARLLVKQGDRALARDGVRLASVSGWAYFMRSALPQSESCYVAGLQCSEVADLNREPECGVILERLGIVVSAAGRMKESLRLCERSAGLLDSLVGRRDERCLRARGTYANRLRIFGQPATGLAMMRADFDSLVAAGLDRTDASLYTRWMLSTMLAAMGEDTQVLRVREGLADLSERLHGPSSVESRGARSDVASILQMLGRWQEAVDIYRATLNSGSGWPYQAPRHHSYLAMEFARSLLRTGELAEARVRLEEAENARRVVADADGFERSFLKSIRVELAWASGDVSMVSKADSILRALQHQLPIQNAERYEIEQVLERYLLWAGADSVAIPYAVQTARGFRTIFNSLVPHLADHELIRFMRGQPDPVDPLLSWCSDNVSRRPSALPEVYGEILRHRGLVRTGLTRRAGMAADPDSIVELRAEIARRVLRSTRGAVELDQQALAESLQLVLRTFERNRRGPESAAGSMTALPADALPTGSALVSYFRFARTQHRREPSALPRTEPIEYLAFVLKSGDDFPEVVSLGPALAIDSLARTWSNLQRGGGRRTQADVVGTKLRELVWDPLVGSLGAARRVFVVPDGALIRVSLPTLRGRDGRYLLEQDLLLHVLTDEYDLLTSIPGPAGKGALAVGGIDFSRAPSLTPAPYPSRDRSARPACGDFIDHHFGPLPASGQEAVAISDAVRAAGRDSCVIALGGTASEAFVRRQLPGRRWVHLATHAFFLADDCAAQDPTGEWVRRDPLVFSGVALAGANHHAEARSATDDGLLTAEEICGLDLRGVEWLVLSGCETGLGMSDRWEAVDGLQRAAREAGVHTTIMSLWPVDDDATSFWMEQLYRARFERSESTALAVRSASRATLAMLRRLGRDPDPRLWGAFIAVGDWR